MQNVTCLNNSMNTLWINRLLFLLAALLLVACSEKSADGTPTPELNIRAELFMLSDSTGVLSDPETDTRVRVDISIGQSNDNVRLERGGNITLHVDGVAYLLDEIETPPLAPYTFEPRFHYEKNIPHLENYTTLRLAVTRPDETDAPSSSLIVPPKPVILEPAENSSHSRLQNLYTSWIQGDSNDLIGIFMNSCYQQNTYLEFYTADVGEYTIQSDVFRPHDLECDGLITLHRTSYGALDENIGRGQFVFRRNSKVSITVTP